MNISTVHVNESFSELVGFVHVEWVYVATELLHSKL
jgi:hypothetical protein